MIKLELTDAYTDTIKFVFENDTLDITTTEGGKPATVELTMEQVGILTDWLQAALFRGGAR